MKADESNPVSVDETEIRAFLGELAEAITKAEAKPVAEQRKLKAKLAVVDEDAAAGRITQGTRDSYVQNHIDPPWLATEQQRAAARARIAQDGRIAAMVRRFSAARADQVRQAQALDHAEIRLRDGLRRLKLNEVPYEAPPPVTAPPVRYEPVLPAGVPS